jgi:hypothetical protein
MPIFSLMPKRALLCALLALPSASAPIALAARSGGERPAPAEPASAKVNTCGGAEGTIGVAVRAPARLGGAPFARIRIEYYSTADGGWHPAAGGDSGWFQVAGKDQGAETGYTFPYAAPSAGHRLFLRGSVQVEWRGAGDSASLGAGTCAVGAGGAPQTTSARPEQSRVVRNDARDAQPRQPRNVPRVVNRPRVQVPTRRPNRADQPRRDQAPVSHDGVAMVASEGPASAAGEQPAVYLEESQGR